MGWRQVKQLNLLVPDAFSDAFRQSALEAGGEPTHLLQAQARVLERYELGEIVREEVSVVRAEGEARAKLGRSAGGQARAAKLSKL
jgi:hypothetical protein